MTALYCDELHHSMVLDHIGYRQYLLGNHFHYKEHNWSCLTGFSVTSIKIVYRLMVCIGGTFGAFSSTTYSQNMVIS